MQQKINPALPIKNNGGTIKHGGVNDSSRSSSELGLEHTMVDVAVSRAAKQATTSAPIAQFREGQYTIITNMELIGLSSTDIRGSYTTPSQHKDYPNTDPMTATAIREGYFSKTNGFASGYPQSSTSGIWDSPNDAIGSETTDYVTNIEYYRPGSLSVLHTNYPTKQYYSGKYGSSSAPQDTTSPTVTVLAPNGGETWTTGTTENITWSATDAVGVTSIDIAWSTAGVGGPYTNIITGTANDSLYAWAIPATTGANNFIRITAVDAVGNSGTDTSDTAFTISIPDVTDPVVNLTAPTGGETLEYGVSTNITWTATDNISVTGIDLALSTVAIGGPFVDIVTGTANDGTFAWSPANTGITNFIRVIAWDAAGNSGVDISDAAFTISDTVAPNVSVIAPNGGETWTTGTSQDITWTATDAVGVTGIDIALSTAGSGGSFTNIVTGTANDGIYSWSIPATTGTNSFIKVTAGDASANSNFDVSDAAFVLAASADITDPVVSVTTPNGGETLNIGAAYNITWTATDNVGVTGIDIELSTAGVGGPYSNVVTGTANDGVYMWTVPSNAGSNNFIRITAGDTAGNTGSDTSNASFTIQVAPVSSGDTQIQDFALVTMGLPFSIV